MAADKETLWGYKEINKMKLGCRKKLARKAFDATLECTNEIRVASGLDETDRVNAIWCGLAELSGARQKCSKCITRKPNKECSLDSGIKVLISNIDKDSTGKQINKYGVYGKTTSEWDFDLTEFV